MTVSSITQIFQVFRSKKSIYKQLVIIENCEYNEILKYIIFGRFRYIVDGN